MKKALFVSLAALLFAITSFPQTTILTGLKDTVTVRRDGRGIPYIEAKNDADLYFAQGYVTASDRLWQMDLMRRLARGETAEIFGGSVLEEDKRWRRFGFAEIANQSLTALTPELRSALDNYAQGVNAYIATLDDNTLPVEFKILQYKPRAWSPTDTIVVGKILADALSTTWRNDLLRLSLQSLSKEKLADLTNQITPYDVVLFGKDTVAQTRASARAIAISSSISPLLTRGLAQFADAEKDELLRAASLARVGLYAEDLAASNNWVISGKRTADGKPILANDPHLAPTAPGIWYLTHLSTSTMRVSGVTFPGVPGIVLGHNEFIAWGATNVGPDVQDLYYETFNDKGEYKTPDGWVKAIVRKEIINVRANPMKPETTQVTLDVTETRNGVIVTEDGGRKYALKWTARDPKNNEFESFFAANRAKNWDDFKGALRKYGGATQNFVYADVKGNIGWYAAGRIPIRRVGDGALPYDGSKAEGDWMGMIPFDDLPNLYNPADGLIVTANQRIVGTSYKYTQISRDAGSPWRARRIHDALDAKAKITMDDVRDVQHDVFNIPLSNLAKEIVKADAASPETLAILKNWDGKMALDSRGSVLANEIRGCIATKMADDNKPVPVFYIRERIVDWAVREKTGRWLPAGFANYSELLKSCDSSSRTSLSGAKRFGPDDTTWLWGKTFVSRFPHPLAAVPFIGAQFETPSVPISGSGQTPNVGSNVSMRHIASPGNWDATRHVIPLGESGDPKSPHFKDQFEAWRTGTPMIFPFSRAAVEKSAVELLVMSPK
ncbi:MAG: penicillin acylase family protein [Pyrinomonadaceae bacterium]